MTYTTNATNTPLSRSSAEGRSVDVPLSSHYLALKSRLYAAASMLNSRKVVPRETINHVSDTLTTLYEDIVETAPLSREEKRTLFEEAMALEVQKYEKAQAVYQAVYRSHCRSLAPEISVKNGRGASASEEGVSKKKTSIVRCPSLLEKHPRQGAPKKAASAVGVQRTTFPVLSEEPRRRCTH